MAKQVKPAPRKFVNTNSNLLKINRIGLPKCLTMDKNLAQHFSKGKLPHTTMLRGGTTKSPLTPEEVAWAQEREQSHRSREETQKTIARIRVERQQNAQQAETLALLKKILGK